MRAKRHIPIRLTLTVLGCLLWTGTALAGPYTQLQVLLPGETAAPGTALGKTGAPAVQVVGVPFTVQVRACDTEWQTVTDVTNIMKLGSTDAEATLPADGPMTAGETTLAVTLNATGSFVFSATDQSDQTIPVGDSALVAAQILAGFVFADIPQKHRDAGTPFGTTITAVGPTGETVTGYSGPVELEQLTSYGPGRITPAQVTLAGGMWSGDVTVYRADETNISSGNVNMHVHLASDPSKNGISNPFIVHPGSFSQLQLVVPGQTALPGSVSGLVGSPATQGAAQPFVVQVYATDDWWNPLPSTDAVRLTSSDDVANTPVDGVLSNGQVQLSVTLGTVGSQTLTVADQSNGGISAMTSAPILVISGGAFAFAIEPLPASVIAGDPVAVTIRAVDAGGNTLPDFQGDANLAANTGAGSISPESISFTNGIWSGTMIFRGAGGAVQFTCSDYATPPHFGTSDPLQVLPGAYTSLQVLLPGQTPEGGTEDGVAGLPAIQAAGGSFDLRVRAVDLYFNRVSAVNSSIALTSTDVNMAYPTDPALVNGEVVLPVTLYRAGYQTVTAADLDVTDITNGTSSQVQVTAGTYSRLLVVAPGQIVSPGAEDGRSGDATDQSISYAFTVQAYATDQWWNPVAGISDVVRLTSSDPLAELPPNTPMADGVADLVLRLSTGGFQQLTVTNITQPSIAASTTEVRAISSGLHLQAVVTPVTVQAGEQFNLTVSVTNDAGSVIQEINTFVNVEVRNATSQEPGRGLLANTRFQLLQGQRVMSETYTFAESIVLTVTDEAGNDPALTDVLTVLPGQPDTLLVSSDPHWVRATRSATITTRVEDEFGNGVPGRTVTFGVTAGAGTLVGDGSAKVDVVTDDSGATTVEFQAADYAGISTITVTADGLTNSLEIETALVDPNAAGGSLTNYPNPFHPDEADHTTIAYVLNDDASVRLRIYTLSGGLVYEQRYERGGMGGTAGHNEIEWDGRNGNGQAVASGGYILFIEAEGNGATMHTMRRKIGVVW